MDTHIAREGRGITEFAVLDAFISSKSIHRGSCRFWCMTPLLIRLDSLYTSETPASEIWWTDPHPLVQSLPGSTTQTVYVRDSVIRPTYDESCIDAFSPEHSRHKQSQVTRHLQITFVLRVSSRIFRGHLQLCPSHLTQDVERL